MKTIKLEDGTKVKISDAAYSLLEKSIKPEFKVGDWVRIINDNEHSCNQIGDIGRIIRLCQESCFDCRVYVFGIEEGGGNLHSFKNLEKVTPEEIEEHLIKEAERRYKDKDKIKSFKGVYKWDKGDRKCHSNIFSDAGFYYDIERDSLTFWGRGLGCCYLKGDWSEIIEQPKIPKLDHEYEAEIFDDYVLINGQKFKKSAIKKLYKAIK